MNVTTAILENFVGQLGKFQFHKLPESFWELEAPFRELVESDFPIDLIDAQLEQLTRNFLYAGNWRPNQIVAHRGNGCSLSILLMEQSRQYVHTLPSLALYAPIGNRSLRYNVYELPPEYRNDLFDPRIRLRHRGEGSIEPRQLLRLDAQRLLYDFIIDEPIPVLRLLTAPIQPMEWLFNKTTGSAWQANDSSLTATQSRVAAYVLGRLADPSSVQPLLKLSENPHHAVRWAAIQGLGRISRSAAVSRLEQAVADPHPHIQRAASRTLAQLKTGV